MARPKKVKEVVSETVATKPEFSAELLIDQKYEYPKSDQKAFEEQYGKSLGFVYYGYIYNDTATNGNHPFQDGSWIHTSLVVKEEEVDGERFIHTLNSVYKVRV